MNKKKIILSVVTIIGIFVFIVVFKTISYRLKVASVENMLLNYYNFKLSDGLDDDCRLGMELYSNEQIQEYDIAKLVDYYLFQLEQAKNDLREAKDTNKQLYVNDNHYYTQYSKNYSWYILDELIDINYVKKELDKELIHRGDDWLISVNADDTIELPYGYYLKYDKRKFELLDKVKKVTNVKFTEKVEFSNKNSNKHSKSFDIDIEYIDKENKKQIDKRFATYNYDTKLWKCSYNEFYFNNFDKAHITLCNHQYDKEKEEAEKRLNEVDALVFESNQELMEQMEEEETGIHHEKTYVFKERGLIWLSHNKKEDIWYYEFSPLVPKKEKKEDIEYLNGFMTGEEDITLPYTEEMTIDEVKEKFYKDKESIKKSLAIWDIDAEEFLNNEDITDEMLDDYVEKQFDLMGYEKKQ